MSDSTREKTRPASRTTSPAGATIDPELGRTGGWWFVSLALHGAVLLALLWFTPLRTIILNPGRDVPFESTASPDRIDEVVTEVRDLQAEMLGFQVEELLDIEQSLQELRDGKLEDYEQFVGEMNQTGPAEALKAQDEALKAQQQAVEELAKAQQTAKEARQGQDQALQAQQRAEHEAAVEQLAKARQGQESSRAAHKRVNEAQLAADAAQSRAAELLTMMGSTMEAARKAQKDAAAAQTDATGAEMDAERLQEDARGRQNQAASRQATVPDRAKRVEQIKPTVAPLEAEGKKLSAEAGEAKAKAAEAGKAAADAKIEETRSKKNVSRAKTPEQKKSAEAAAEAAAKEADRLGKLSDQLKDEARKKEEAARGATGRLSRAKQELAKAEGDLQRRWAESKESQTQAAGLQKPAIDAAAKAQEAQQKAIEAQQKARDALAKSIAEGVKLAASEATPDAAKDDRRPNLFGMNLAGVYEQAVQAERRSTEAYKEVRAADLAIIRKIPLDQARDQTDVARPIRPELDRKLLTAPVRDMETANRHKQEVEKAVREVDSMVTLGRRLLELAQAGEGDGRGGADVSLDWYRAKAAQQEELTRAATEDDAAKAKDLTGLMQQGAGEEGTAGGQAAAAAEGAGKAGSKGKPGGGPGWANFPPVIKRDLKPIAGRKVMSGGLPSDWMYVDSWYVLGPFPNPRRINRDKKFPPESVVDLDAKYVGKDGKVIRWEFLQSPEAMVVPAAPQEYAIYYAYTELWFEKPMDLWVAVGSDDKSSLWIEDQPVWVSGNQLKAWQVAEGMRRVHFKKGLNHVLYRIENGWQRVAWSLVLHTKPRPAGG